MHDKIALRPFEGRISAAVRARARPPSGSRRESRRASPSRFPQFPLVVSFCAADGLLDPSVNGKPAALAELANLKTLVLYCLFVAGDSDVAVNHNCLFKISVIMTLLLLE